MKTITTSTRFVAEPVKIPNAVNESAGVDDNAGLNNIIEESERDILIEALGKTQYAAYQTALDQLPFNPAAVSNAPQEYIDLVNGTSDGLWEGLHPLLDNYIFCQWLKATEVKLTMVGSGKGKSQGFSVADNSSKFTERWNKFVEKLQELKVFLGDSIDLEVPEDFPCYETTNSLGL